MPNAAGGLSHNEFQEQITKAAALFKWKHLHVRKSTGKNKSWQTTTNRTGWPDLFLWHPHHGFLAIEVKVGKDTPTPEQLQVLDELARAGAQTLIAYPADWDVIEKTLRGAA